MLIFLPRRASTPMEQTRTMDEHDDDVIGVIGGSGFYEFLDAAEAIEVETPYGPPASPITIGRVGTRRVAFLARHGVGHRFAAHRVPYRANVWALHSIGVRTLVAPCSVGSLQPQLAPGQMVVVDQLVDRTWGRRDTFFDVGAPAGSPGGDAELHHQSFAEPYDAGLRRSLVAAARRVGVDAVDGGTMVVINGPRFSTRAESQWFRQMGWDVVNMTGYPESVLAAELGIRYAALALITDHDAGVDGHVPVSMDAVFAVMRANVDRVRRVILEAVVGDPGL
jgi:5'-methylthioadenosine phosphorylase